MEDKRNEFCIIGAGMAGLACATALVEAGRSVQVLDKGRGPGGRMAARRADIANETVSFDHGAQFFTARDAKFRAAVSEWEAQGAVARWAAASKSDDDPAWVGVPGMNGPIRTMAETLGVEWSARAERISREGALWRIETPEAIWRAETVLVAVPAEQAAQLLVEAAPDLAAIPARVRSEPCWAVMAAFAGRIGFKPDVLRDPGAAISWAARNSAKPGRAGEECWVLHASPQRSRELIDFPKEEVGPLLLADFFKQTPAMPIPPIHLAAQSLALCHATSRAGRGRLF